MDNRALIHIHTEPGDLRTRLAATEGELARVLAAVEHHLSDPTAGADARLYSAVLSAPLALVDNRVDDPNDWPVP